MAILFCVDNPDLSIVLTGILPSESDIQKLGMGIICNPVGTKIEFDLIYKLQSVAAEYANHTVISARDEYLVEGWNVRNALWFFKSRNAFQPFARLKIDHFDRAILEPRHKEPLAFHVHIHVVNAAFYVRHGNGLDESE